MNLDFRHDRDDESLVPIVVLTVFFRVIADKDRAFSVAGYLNGRRDEPGRDIRKIIALAIPAVVIRNAADFVEMIRNRLLDFGSSADHPVQETSIRRLLKGVNLFGRLTSGHRENACGIDSVE